MKPLLEKYAPGLRKLAKPALRVTIRIAVFLVGAVVAEVIDRYLLHFHTTDGSVIVTLHRMTFMGFGVLTYLTLNRN